MVFADLAFKPHPSAADGVQATAFFPNGYGASVVRFRYSYGGADGLYEVAVLAGNADKWDLTDETPITDDVVGHCTEDRVSELLAQIEALPAREVA